MDKQPTFDFLNKKDKHFFASFFNLAMDNFDIALGAVSSGKCKSINDLFPKNISLTDFENTCNRLERYLPVLACLNMNKEDNTALEEKVKLTRNALSGLYKTIKQHRNYYNHSYHKPIDEAHEIKDVLEHCFLFAVREIKKSLKDEATRSTLRDSFKEDFEQLKEEQTAYIQSLIDNAKSNSAAKRYSKDAKSIESGVFNNLFSRLAEKGKEGKLMINETRHPLFSENNLSTHGFMFLLSLFLKREEMEQLMNKVSGYKANHKLWYYMTRRVYTFLTFKGVKKQVTTQYAKETLLMQMADELSKIPDELYQQLTEEEKAIFRIDINEYYKDNEEEGVSAEDKIVVHDVIRKRYKQEDAHKKSIDKFEYFALRFLDECANLKNIRFMVNMGNIISHSTQKEIAGRYSERIIMKKLVAFEKLSNAINAKNEYIANHQENVEEYGVWQSYPHSQTPHYHFQGNNIPIYLKGAEQPIVDDKDGRKNADIAKAVFGEDVPAGKPSALLSLYELPAFLHRFFKKERPCESFIEQRYGELRAELNSSKPNCNLLTNRIQKRNELNVDIDTDKLKNAIQKEINESSKKLEELAKWKKEYNAYIRNKHTKSPKSPKRSRLLYNSDRGEIATFLADDIKRWMTASFKEEWKGYQHRELQKMLAFYREEKKNIRDFIPSQYLPKFINEAINKKHDLEDFYEYYLIKRKEEFETFKAQFEQNKDTPKILKKVLKDLWKVFKKSSYILPPVASQINELKKHPLKLGRGVFDTAPTYNDNDSMDDKADWFRFAKDESSKGLQSFYKYQEDKLQAVAGESSSDKRKRIKVYRAVEKQKIKDVYTLEMIKHLYKEIFDADIDEIKLSDFYQTPQERVAIQSVANLQRDRKEGDTSANIYNERFIWNKVVRRSFKNERIVVEQIKLKDIGKFERLLQDPKVDTLLSYDTKTWEKRELEDELRNYQQVRQEQIFKLIHALEKEILNKQGFKEGDKHPPVFEKGGNPNFRKYIEEGSYFSFSDEEKEILNEVNYKLEALPQDLMSAGLSVQRAYIMINFRNNFAHNKLPSAEVIELCKTITGETKIETEFYADYLYRVLDKVIRM